MVVCQSVCFMKSSKGSLQLENVTEGYPFFDTSICHGFNKHMEHGPSPFLIPDVYWL